MKRGMEPFLVLNRTISSKSAGEGRMMIRFRERHAGKTGAPVEDRKFLTY